MVTCAGCVIKKSTRTWSYAKPRYLTTGMILSKSGSNLFLCNSCNHVTYLTDHFRCLDILAPHDAEQADALAKGTEMERLYEVGIRAEFVGSFHILFKIGT